MAYKNDAIKHILTRLSFSAFELADTAVTRECRAALPCPSSLAEWLSDII